VTPSAQEETIVSADTATVELSVVIPAFNEAARIAGALDAVHLYLVDRGVSHEIIVADDGSRDATASIVSEFAAQRGSSVRLISLGVNQGKGAALRAGVAATRGRRVLMVDADQATPISELAKLEAAFCNGVSIVTGSRALATSRITRSQSRLRVLLGRAGNLWIRSWAVPGVHDTQCGFKLFEGDLARHLFKLSRENRFGIDVEILCLARRRMRLPITEVGVEWRHQSGSKVRLRDYVDVFIKVPRIVVSVLSLPSA
jgi:dolichyl-phosphate beta-glucosyltransferase